ncbi:polysaccharide deacetylase family protein [Streptomyces hoynatensis]|uniref:Polysaccharide deacetylase n=1 Tax=Streptomyces hoynatensis TaxID=1141874 RepID=A0A3A9YPE5_9ACTN|nr:polysaccharide deacetylase family protein [Streptomyces hoynatensis]RKN38011.1 polysaccharide deacetylase [Streptomyces hoynatensis]
MRHAPRRLLFPLLLLLAAGGALAFGPARHRDTHTVVSLTFDDGAADQFANARPALRAHRLPATFYVNSGRIGREGHLTAGQVRQLATEGHEIGGHTLTHARLTELSPAGQRREICEDRSALLDLGLSPTTFAYPYGADTAEGARLAAACGYQAARDIGGIRSPRSCASCAAVETFPPRAVYAVRTPDSADAETTLADLKRYVTQAEEAGGGWVPLVFHHVCDPCAGGAGRLAVSPGTLEKFLAWLRPRARLGTRVETVADALAG